MIYNSMGSAGHGKHEIVYKESPRLLMKSTNFFLLDRKTYDANKLLEVIWKHAGFLCARVDFHHQYRTEDGQLAHTYNLYFHWGKFGNLEVTNAYINQIMYAIEQDLPNYFPCDLRGRDHSPRRS
jgi:hypothetical protein